ncbi:MAG: hypothetical protein U0232_12605 [Thermomicrobiales bacterium]
MQTGLLPMIKKRSGWLAALFLGEMLTATAMGYFQGEISKAVVLALFVPLIISSGGNPAPRPPPRSSAPAALREVGLRDWWRIFLRELPTGLPSARSPARSASSASFPGRCWAGPTTARTPP